MASPPADSPPPAAEPLRFDGVQIAAEEPERAARAYAVLLGSEPLRLHSGAWRFQLERGAVDIEPGPPGLRSMRFACAGELPPGIDFHGLEVRTTPLIAAGEAGGTPPRSSPLGGADRVRDTAVPGDAVRAIDHVVVACADAARALALWRDRLGLRLALDREFPSRGLRMLFFRSGGVTLELVSAIGAGDPAGRDALNGVAYEVGDLVACRARLCAAGLDVSPLRDGNKKGTRVATVRSGTEGVPTLLIEHTDRGAWRDAAASS